MYCFKYKLQYTKKILHYVFLKEIMSRYNHKKFVQLNFFLKFNIRKKKDYISFHRYYIIL